MKQLAISIVMPLYNKDREVGRAIGSVLSQTFQDFEIVVVNDGSTDMSPEVVRNIKDIRIRVVDQPNSGVSAARNRGIQEARADVIAFLDADDEWLPDFLETIYNLKEKFPTCSVFATKYYFCSPVGRKRLPIIRGLPKGFSDGVLIDYFDIASRSDPPLWTSAVAVEKKAITKVGGFPVGLVLGEDLLTWARLAALYDIAYYNEPKSYCWGPDHISDRPGRVPEMPDLVGDELAKLLRYTAPRRSEGLRDYISFWHGMRASILVQLGEGRKAREEVRKAVDHSGMGLKLLMLYAVSNMPEIISSKAFNFLIFMKNKMHRIGTVRG